MEVPSTLPVPSHPARLSMSSGRWWVPERLGEEMWLKDMGRWRWDGQGRGEVDREGGVTLSGVPWEVAMWSGADMSLYTKLLGSEGLPVSAPPPPEELEETEEFHMVVTDCRKAWFKAWKKDRIYFPAAARIVGAKTRGGKVAVVVKEEKQVRGPGLEVEGQPVWVDSYAAMCYFVKEVLGAVPVKPKHL